MREIKEATILRWLTLRDNILADAIHLGQRDWGCILMWLQEVKELPPL